MTGCARVVRMARLDAAGALAGTNAAETAKVEPVDNGAGIYYQINVAGLDGAFMALIQETR